MKHSANDPVTQRVTAVDLERGQIRIPSVNTSSAKALFPSERSDILLLLKGRKVDCHWDPHMGPDRERSGVIRVGAVLNDLVRENEVLVVRRNGDQLVLE